MSVDKAAKAVCVSCRWYSSSKNWMNRKCIKCGSELVKITPRNYLPEVHEGQRFNQWVIVDDNIVYNKHHLPMVLCRCDCSNIKYTYISSLVNGMSRSCGCLRDKYYLSKTNTIENFLAFIDKADNDSCWIWNGSVGASGYGQMYIKKVKHNAHRLSYEYHNKCSIPVGLFVLHKCDNRKCVNPNHLFLGTAKDNYQDAKSKDRHTRGERCSHSRLTDELVLKIRSSYTGRRGEIRAIARELNMSETNIGDVIKRKIWNHI